MNIKIGHKLNASYKMKVSTFRWCKSQKEDKVNL